MNHLPMDPRLSEHDVDRIFGRNASTKANGFFVIAADGKKIYPLSSVASGLRISMREAQRRYYNDRIQSIAAPLRHA